jgi:hypothetical protein
LTALPKKGCKKAFFREQEEFLEEQNKNFLNKFPDILEPSRHPKKTVPGIFLKCDLLPVFSK